MIPLLPSRAIAPRLAKWTRRDRCVAEFARIQIVPRNLNSGEFSYCLLALSVSVGGIHGCILFPCTFSTPDVGKRPGIDRAAICRLENRIHENPTISTLNRYAEGLVRRISFRVVDVGGSATACTEFGIAPANAKIEDDDQNIWAGIRTNCLDRMPQIISRLGLGWHRQRSPN